MPYVNVPNDLSKIKTKMAFNLTKRQLVCFGSAGAVGIPAYLLTRGTLGNTGAMFLMLGIMLPAFLLAMYEKDGLPFEKVVRNIIRAKFLRPGIRAYRTENIYAPFAGPGAGKEDVIENTKKKTEPPPRVKAGRPCLPNRQSRICPCTRTVCASSRVGSIQKLWNMRTSITPWHPPRIRLPYSADGVHFSTTLTVHCRSSFPLSTVVPIPAAAIKSISRKRMTTITASGMSLPGC